MKNTKSKTVPSCWRRPGNQRAELKTGLDFGAIMAFSSGFLIFLAAPNNQLLFLFIIIITMFLFCIEHSKATLW